MNHVFVGILNPDNRVYSGNEIDYPDENYLERIYGKISDTIHRIPIIITIAKTITIILVTMEEYETLSKEHLLRCNVPLPWDQTIANLIQFDINNPN